MSYTSLGDQTVKKFIPPRKLESRKGENGKIVVVGGSNIYHGAPILSSFAAMASGADLVYTAVPKVNLQSTRSISPDLMVIPMADAKLTKGTVNKLLGMLPRNIDSSTIGMGLAVKEIAALKSLVKALLDSAVKPSLDASALVPEILDIISESDAVVTPHAGEFKRLFGESPPVKRKDRLNMVSKYAKKYSVTILLKGWEDVISDGEKSYINSKKTPSMTVGGTGDVLSGLVAGMLPKTKDSLQAAATATYINGKAGLLAQKRFGFHLRATNLIEYIVEAMKPFDKTK